MCAPGFYFFILILFYQGIIFKSFETFAKIDRSLSIELIPTALTAVEEDEKLRGCGRDAKLR